jgi:phosphoglycolate phosphatase-like HAD superfamily hydrolase
MVSVAPKIIVWDFDGTLINSFEVYRTIVSNSLRKRGLAVPSKETFLIHNHGLLHDSIRDVSDISESLAKELTDEFLAEEDVFYEKSDQLLFADAVNFAKRAHEKGITQLLVTNRGHQGRTVASPRYIIANSELKDLISLVVAGDDSTFRKPDKRVLDVVTGYDFSRDVLVIGDQFVDAELAHNLNADAILVQRHDKFAHAEKLKKHAQIVMSLDDVAIR